MPKKYGYLIAGFMAAKIVLHFAANSRYGLNADELYHIALSRHLAWGYTDNAPWVPGIARLSYMLFGDTVFAWRILPTLFSALTLGLTGAITVYSGGKKLAVCITCTAILCSPALLATSYLLQPVVFELFFWCLTALFLIRLRQTGRIMFVYLSVSALALGFINKYSILVYALPLFAGFFLSGKKPVHQLWQHWAGASFLGLFIVLPNLLWQAAHGFHIVQYLSVVRAHTYFKGTGDYLFQFLFFHGAGMAVWLAGLGFIITNKKTRPYLFVCAAFVACSAFFVLSRGKIYYALGAFTPLFAIGGLCWEKMLVKAAQPVPYAFFTVLLLPALIALPLVVPLFSFKLTLQYLELMTTYTRITQPLRWEDGRVHQVPQFYAAMYGWPEVVQKIGYAAAQAGSGNTVLLTESYGIAAAAAYYGGARIPAIFSPANSFAGWSPPRLNAAYVVLPSRKSLHQLRGLARQIKLCGTIRLPYAQEHGTHIYLLKTPSARLKQLYRRGREKFLGKRY